VNWSPVEGCAGVESKHQGYLAPPDGPTHSAQGAHTRGRTDRVGLKVARGSASKPDTNRFAGATIAARKVGCARPDDGVSLPECEVRRMTGMRQKETSMRRTLDPPDTSGSRDRIGLSFHSFGPAPKEWRRPAGRRHRVFGAGAAQLHREGRTTMFQLAIWIGSWQKTDTPAGRGCTLP